MPLPLAWRGRCTAGCCVLRPVSGSLSHLAALSPLPSPGSESSETTHKALHWALILGAKEGKAVPSICAGCSKGWAQGGQQGGPDKHQGLAF